MPPATVFTALPQDLLQHEINYFLDAESRIDFNAVLKPDERVYKKMPTDFALKHAIKTTFYTYKSIELLTDFYMDGIYGTDYRRMSYGHSAEKSLMRIFNIWSQPLNALAIMYQGGLKENLLASLELWMENDPENLLYNTVCDGGTALRLKAAEAHAKVQSIPFHHHIPIADVDF